MFLFVKVILYSSTSSTTDVQAALNDLPTLYPNLVTNVNQTISGTDKTFIITFSSDLGNF